MNKFQVNFNCIILAYNTQDDLTYVLSKNKDDIEPINFLLTTDILNNDYNNYITNFVKQLFLINMEDFEMYPQLIKFHDSNLDTDKQTINCIFGFFVSFTDRIKENLYWIPYSPNKKNKYSNTILDVVRHIQ